jgi:hypothetical protein
MNKHQVISSREKQGAGRNKSENVLKATTGIHPVSILTSTITIKTPRQRNSFLRIFLLIWLELRKL